MHYQPLDQFLKSMILEKNIPLETIFPEPEIFTSAKDFDTWNIFKKNIEFLKTKIICHEREIWWCSLGLNIGHEQDGKNENFERPVLIIKILSKDTFLGVPLTSSDKKHFFHTPLKSYSEKSCALISQARTISNKRLLREIATISQKDFFLVKKSLHALID